MDYHNGNEEDADSLFDNFLKASTCKSILHTFHQLCDEIGLKHTHHHHFYRHLSSRLTSWKAQWLWAKLNKRQSLKEYRRGEACRNTRVLVIGGGPCGLRVAIEAAFLGCKVVVVEKRDSFSRNNVLHLWPYLITDLKNLGAKKFFGKFCAGAIDHISIRQLQCILMKVALIVGVEIHVNVAFEGLREPPADQMEDHKIGWRCNCDPPDHVVSEYEFDVLIGADGKRNTLQGFKRKEFRGKLAIAITANFINRNTQEEARVEEISGVAFIFNQKFFKDLNKETGIDLENIVYYKDDTHYFVMTAKKSSLLDKGVLLVDHADTAKLLASDNVDRNALLEYAKEAADFSTDHQLPNLEYAINHYRQQDVAMFDFTSMFQAINASRVIERNDHRLLMGLVGDSLIEPFWPTGSGCARGFLGAFDMAWMIRSWASGKMTPLQVVAERESIYQLLSQTTPENISKNFNEYSIDPNTRYPNLNAKLLKTDQVRHLYDCGDITYTDEILDNPSKKFRGEEIIDSYSLLHWCQRVLNHKYRNVHIIDFTSSWRSGLALCALIHAFKPSLIDLNSLNSLEIAQNNQLAFDVAQRELGISPPMAGVEMEGCDTPDKLTMVSYLSQFYDKFRRERNPSIESPHRDVHKSHKSPLHRTLLQKIRNSAKFTRSKKKKEEDKNEYNVSLSKRKHEQNDINQNGDVRLTKYNKLPMDEIATKLTVDNVKKDVAKTTNDPQPQVNVSAMAEILTSKFKGLNQQPAPSAAKAKARSTGVLLAAQPESEICYFCKKRVYIMERMTAENVFFHRGCLKCDFCLCGLRVNNYSCERSPTGKVTFYCFRHSRPEMRLGRSRRKRAYLDDEENSKENIPKLVVDASQSPKLSPRKDGSPRKIPAPLSPPLQPEVDLSKPKRTPERIEFENSIDGMPEVDPEEELLEHNLRASISADGILGNDYEQDDMDSDSESSDDEELQEAVESTYGHNVSKDLTIEEALAVVKTLKRRSHENLIEAVEMEDEEMDDEEVEEEEDEDDEEDEESDNEDETSDTEDADVEKTSPDLSLNLPSNDNQTIKAQKNARLNFFTTPPEPVRLDPFKMFGMGKKAEEKVEETTDGAVNNNVVKENMHEEAEMMVEEDVQEEEFKLEDKIEVSTTIEKKTDSEKELDDEEDDVFEDDDDKVAMSIQMERILADIEHKSSVSDNGENNRSSASDALDVKSSTSEVGERSSSSSEVELSDSEEGLGEGKDGEGTKEYIGSGETERAVLQSVQEMKSSSSTSESSHSTHQAVLSSIERMEEPENQEIEREFNSIDDRFVTKGRGSSRKQKQKRVHRNSFGSDSSFTISTPSESLRSSLSSLVENIQAADDAADKPDPDFIKDYCLTLSQVLDEEVDEEIVPPGSEDGPRRGSSLGSEDTPRPEVSPLDDTLVGEEETLTSPRRGRKSSSMYVTPNQSVSEERFHSISDVEQDLMESKVGISQSAIDSEQNDRQSFDSDMRTDVLPNASSEDARSQNSEIEIDSEKTTNDTMSGSMDTKYNSDGSTWRPLPPLPKEALDKVKKDKSSKKKKLPVVSDKQESGRKLPDISNLKSKNSSGFQSNFMKQHLGSPTGTDSSEKDGSGSPEVIKKGNKDGGKSEANKKKKISVDHAKLRSVNSVDNDSSSQNESIPGMKKIRVDTQLRERVKAEPVKTPISASHHIDDIPFADDSEDDMLQEFKTPATSVKTKPPREENMGKDVRKRILPLPPKSETSKKKSSAIQGNAGPDTIRQKTKADIESAREIAREKARLKSDEELGLMNMGYTPRKNYKTSTSCTPSTSDFPTDSDDAEKILHSTPIVDKTELPPVSGKSTTKKKKKFSLFPPKKSPEKNSKGLKDNRSSSNDTLEEKSPKKKKKTPKSDKKKKHMSESALEHLDKGLSELNLHGVTPRFTGDPHDKHSLKRRPGFAVRRTMPPKANLDEFSDSDESHYEGHLDTLTRRHGKERRTMSEDELNMRIAKRVQSAARKQMKQREQKRLRMAQEIQRQLEEVDVKQRDLEEKGVIVEKALRGEGPDAGREEAELMQEWFQLVYEKNALVRYESELMVNAQYMELEDRHGRLEQALREKMAVTGLDKTAQQAAEEKRVLDELLEVVEERNKLVAMLEEDRVREQEEDRDLRKMMQSKGFDLLPNDYTNKIKYSSGLFPLSC
ncbi:hypothetical protein FSP39_000031 [Pinctada imbricata]|uniref:F-actin monooxygenase n=1 Tax=Pinctada imbricata TaxID=66713 RepID=A0AA88Y840_PINIB|nr:hypothetical protein FSP39_000031 [Pinctada imbricata]